jgi:hypothetical protein
MKPSVILLSLATIAAVATVFAFPPAETGTRLGNLTSESKVLTPTDDINQPSVTTKDGFPVFQIRIPEGYVEVQVRASLTNFEPGFLLKKNDLFTHNYIPTGVEVNGRKQYRALGTDFLAEWNGSEWTFGQDGLTSFENVADPWDCSVFSSNTGIAYSVKKEYFVYRFCTTGIPADAEWGLGSGDPDAWVYFANQSANPGDNTEFKRVKWDENSSLTAQLQPGGTPGYTVLFQPSRDNLGAIEWMQQNHDKLVWIYQVESPAGKPKHPNNSDVWNSMHPVEWRKSRITLTP